MIPDDEYRRSVRLAHGLANGAAMMVTCAMVVTILLDRTIAATCFGLSALAAFRLGARARAEIESWR